jgi:hypothetical protein
MTARFLIVLVCAAQLAAIAGPVSAQSQNPPPAPAAPRAPAPTAPAPPQPPQPPAPRKPGQLINIKTEFTITDQRGTGAAIKRTVSLIVADGDAGFIRSEPTLSDGFGGNQLVQLNIDVRPEILTNGRIRLGFSLQYDGPSQAETEASGMRVAPGDLRGVPRGTVMKSNLRESVSLILEDGKSIMVAQSADPIGDRQVMVDVKATIMK